MRRAAVPFGATARISHRGLGEALEGERLHALGRNRVTAGDRLGDFAGELDHGFAHLRALGDEAVEGGAGIFIAAIGEEIARLLAPLL